jgi:hypothetical protein
MARLHERLDTVDPSLAAGESPWERLRAWVFGVDRSLYSNRVSVLGLGIAAAAAVLFFGINRPDSPAIAPPAPAASDSVHMSIASSASSPFSDPAADNLEFRSGARPARQGAAF